MRKHPHGGAAGVLSIFRYAAEAAMAMISRCSAEPDGAERHGAVRADAVLRGCAPALASPRFHKWFRFPR